MHTENTQAHAMDFTTRTQKRMHWYHLHTELTLSGEFTTLMHIASATWHFVHLVGMLQLVQLWSARHALWGSWDHWMCITQHFEAIHVWLYRCQHQIWRCQRLASWGKIVVFEGGSYMKDPLCSPASQKDGQMRFSFPEFFEYLHLRFESLSASTRAMVY